MRFLLACLLFLIVDIARGDRLKDLVSIEGVRENPLIGYGIVVGLAGTGDDASSEITRNSLATMMKQLGIIVSPDDIKAKNVAAVIVTAQLPPFASPGMTISVTVSSLGTSKNLQGGTLLMTPLKGADLKTYAIAQGALTTGGFSFEGSSGSSSQKNHPTVAQIPSGAIIERAAPGALPENELMLLLKKPDFTTASRIAESIEKKFGASTAQVTSPARIKIKVPDEFKGKTASLIASLEALEATPDVEAKVVIDEKTGTIVIGQSVTLSPASIVYGSLQIEIEEKQQVSQPEALSTGKTTATNESSVAVQQEPGALKTIPQATTVQDVAAALNALGVKPRDLTAILRALHAAGALHAKIEAL
jgi:flagellar P-ring protein precursor FlgI